MNKENLKIYNLNPLSYTAIPTSMHFKETNKKLASGTSFIYERNDTFYLITNWHNVTGLNPLTKKNLGSHGGIPDEISFSLLIQNKPNIQWKTFSVNLYDDDNKACWLVHPIHKELVDVKYYGYK